MFAVQPALSAETYGAFKATIRRLRTPIRIPSSSRVRLYFNMRKLDRKGTQMRGFIFVRVPG